MNSRLFDISYTLRLRINRAHLHYFDAAISTSRIFAPSLSSVLTQERPAIEDFLAQEIIQHPNEVWPRFSRMYEDRDPVLAYCLSVFEYSLPLSLCFIMAIIIHQASDRPNLRLAALCAMVVGLSYISNHVITEATEVENHAAPGPQQWQSISDIETGRNLLDPDLLNSQNNLQLGRSSNFFTSAMEMVSDAVSDYRSTPEALHHRNN